MKARYTLDRSLIPSRTHKDTFVLMKARKDLIPINVNSKISSGWSSILGFSSQKVKWNQNKYDNIITRAAVFNILPSSLLGGHFLNVSWLSYPQGLLFIKLLLIPDVHLLTL